MNKVGIGLLGCGSWGRNYIRNFDHLSEAEVVACCDLDEARLAHARSAFPGVRATSDFDSVLEDPAIGAVVIATPPPTHFSLALKAASLGKHTLVEKPLTLAVSDSRELIAAAERAGIVLMAGHIMVHNSGIQRLRELIEDGEVGKVRYVYLSRTNLGMVRSDVNVMWDLAPHDVSILNHVLGRLPRTVRAVGKAFVQPGVEDVVILILEYDDGVFATIHLSWLDPHKSRRVTVIGDKKMIAFDDLAAVDKIRIYDIGVDYDPASEREYEDFAAYQLSYRYGDIVIPRVPVGEPLAAQCAAFVRAITQGDKPVSDGRAGLEVVAVCEAADQSLKEDGAPIPVVV